MAVAGSALVEGIAWARPARASFTRADAGDAASPTPESQPVPDTTIAMGPGIQRPARLHSLTKQGPSEIAAEGLRRCGLLVSLSRGLKMADAAHQICSVSRERDALCHQHGSQEHAEDGRRGDGETCRHADHGALLSRLMWRDHRSCAVRHVTPSADGPRRRRTADPSQLSSDGICKSRASAEQLPPPQRGPSWLMKAFLKQGGPTGALRQEGALMRVGGSLLEAGRDGGPPEQRLCLPSDPQNPATRNCEGNRHTQHGNN
jgi:hypothetical protein